MFDLLLVSQIRLVTDEKLVDTFDGVSVDLLQPLLDVREGVYKGGTLPLWFAKKKKKEKKKNRKGFSR